MKPKLFVKQGQHFTRVANRAKPFQWAVISNEDIAKHGLYIAVRDEARRAFKKGYEHTAQHQFKLATLIKHGVEV